MSEGLIAKCERLLAEKDAQIATIEADAGKAHEVARQMLREKDAQIAALHDAAEMLWVVLANVSESNWSKQTHEWQVAAARWRDNYFAAISKTPAAHDPFEDVIADGGLPEASLRETPAPSQEHLSGVNDDYYMPGHKDEV